MGDAELVELVMNSLLGRLVDSSHIVRMLCIRGLGNIASVGREQVGLYHCCNSILRRLVDSSHIVPMLCIRGLGNIASVGREQILISP